MGYLSTSSVLKVLNIADAGVIGSERVLIEVLSNCVLGDTVLLTGNSKEEKFFNPNSGHYYWFPSDVKFDKGDIIRLYTKTGQDNISKGTYFKNPVKFRNLFWGLNEPIWTDSTNALVLLAIQDWFLWRKQ